MSNNVDEILNWLITISCQLDQINKSLSEMKPDNPPQIQDFSEVVTSATGNTFGERLSCLLKKRRLRPVDLARRANISPSTVSRYLNGSMIPRTAHLGIIASVLSVDVSVLIDGVDCNVATKAYWPSIQILEGEHVSIVPTYQSFFTIRECYDVLKSWRDSGNYNILRAWIDVYANDKKLRTINVEVGELA